MPDRVIPGSTSNDTDTSSAVSAKYIWTIFALAVIARATVLLLNIYWDIPPYWESVPRVALALAWSDFGAIPLGADFAKTFHMNAEGALNYWPTIDRAFIYLYVLVHKVVGQVSFLHIQTLGLLVDALMVFPVISIARQIAGPGAAIAAGITYALFLPEIQMAAGANYNAWLTYSLIVMTWIAMKIFKTSYGFSSTSFWLLIGGMAVANIAANELRSVSALFAVGAAGWLAMVSVIEMRSLALPMWRWQQIGSLVMVGVLTLFVAGVGNSIVRGEFSPVRSSFGHSFWTGIGQFANPYGVIADDGSVAAFYERGTGLTDTGYLGGVEYNAWLTERAFEFIEEHPGLYASMVGRRALMIIFPNMAFTPVADLPSFTRIPDQIKLIERRKELVAKSGWVSWDTLSEITRIHPEYIVSLLFRVGLLLVLPVGIFAALVMAPSKPRTVMACLPLAYIVITLSGFLVTPVVFTAAHSATLPVAVAGWFLILKRLTGHFRGY